MTKKYRNTLLASAILCGLLAGCGEKTTATAPAGEPLQAAETIPLSGTLSSQLAPVAIGGKSYLLLASETRGLVLLDGAGSEIAALNDAEVERFTVQAREAGGWLVAAFEENRGEIQLYALDDTSAAPGFRRLGAQAGGAPLEALCLSRQSQRTHLFTVDEAGLGREYVVTPGGENWALTAVRPLYFGPQVSGCAVDDRSGRLLVAQPPLGIWSLNADAETDEERRIFAAAPGEEFGGLWLDVAAGLLWLAADDRVLAYTLGTPGAAPIVSHSLDGLEPVSVAVADGHLLALEDESGAVQRFTVKTPQGGAQTTAGRAEIPRVSARAQTPPVASMGDAADDPAIWVNPADVDASLILGTDKKGGLNVYDLTGKLLRQLPVGRVNNVDLRPVQHPQFAAIAAASNRSTPGINLFGITEAGQVENLGLRPLDIGEPYGLCMAQSSGKNFVWVSDKEGGINRFEILLGESSADWQLQSRGGVKVSSQVEGCVVDDARARLFFGEEDRGVWRLDLAAFEAGEGRPQLVAEADGERLVADVEGVDLYLDGEESYLVVSSQGNNSYALFSRDGSRYLGHFRVDMNLAAGVDGASETDGLAVTSARLIGEGFDYPRGLLVVQDGRKRMPAGRQNFKLVSWADIEEKLQLR